jgi:hypothetical protein
LNKPTPEYISLYQPFRDKVFLLSEVTKLIRNNKKITIEEVQQQVSSVVVAMGHT